MSFAAGIASAPQSSLNVHGSALLASRRESQQASFLSVESCHSENLFPHKEGNDREINNTNETIARVLLSRIRGCGLIAKRRSNSNPVILRLDAQDHRSWQSSRSSMVLQNRNDEFENFVKNDFIPVMNQAGVTYVVSQTIFGGDANEYVTLTMRDSFADLDKGPVLVQALGQEGAQKLMQKLPAGAVVHVERSLTRFVPELSILPVSP